MPLDHAAFVTATLTRWLPKTRKHRQRSLGKSLFASMTRAGNSLTEGVVSWFALQPSGGSPKLPNGSVDGTKLSRL